MRVKNHLKKFLLFRRGYLKNIIFIAITFLIINCTFFKNVYSSEPEEARRYNKRAIDYIEAGKLDEALTALNKALEIDPNFAEAYFNLGVLYCTRGLTDRGIDEFRKALKLQPNNAKMHLYLGRAYVDIESFDNAIEEYKQAIRLNPKDATTYFELGMTYHDKGLLESAIENMQQAVRYNRKFVKAREALKSFLEEKRLNPGLEINTTDTNLLWSYRTKYGANKVLISSDGEYIAIGTSYGQLYFFDKNGNLLWIRYGKRTPMYFGYSSGLNDFCMSENGNYISAVSHDGILYFYDKTGKRLWSYDYKGTSMETPGVAVSPEGNYIAVIHYTHIHFFNKEGKLLWSHKLEERSYKETIATCLDGNYIAAGAYNKIYFFNKEGKMLWDYKTEGHIYEISISKDGNYLAVGTFGSVYGVYFLNKEGKLLWNIERTGGERQISYPTVSLSSNGTHLAMGDNVDGKIKLFNQTGSLLWSYNLGNKDFVEVSISPEGKYIIAAQLIKSSGRKESSGKLYLFNEEGKLLWEYRADLRCSNLAISGDGRYIIAAGGKYYYFANSGN